MWLSEARYVCPRAAILHTHWKSGKDRSPLSKREVCSKGTGPACGRRGGGVWGQAMQVSDVPDLGMHAQHAGLYAATAACMGCMLKGGTVNWKGP